jgi:carbamoyltransferase
MYVQAQQGYRIKPINTASLGIEFKNEEIFKCLSDTGATFEEVDDPAETAAELIADGEIVAWFQGRAEVGPRALGNRSLLALPSDKNMRQRINMVIKKREWWRPLAASMAEEDAEIYIKAKGPLPYMVVTAEIIPSLAEQFKSAIHEDGTTRPQTVSIENNRIYYELLMNMKKKTGHALVLDTSLNGPDEPIVSSPLDALKFLRTSQVDKMVIGNFLVKNPTQDSRDLNELRVYENLRT